MKSKPAATFESWAIYNVASERIRSAGSSPVGDATKQPLLEGEALFIGPRADPRLHKIVTDPDGTAHRETL